ncbi:hypothetical protein [Anaeromyxobacter sp. PSR-1]|uniref:hypothetical protein n=1 Tax=unclassified Anaeromyxobacter TaxID=2620896 RepID=UPI0005E7501B|nr:hypothetical protein [Anaeromyxobacter sp. PSR-1]GAO04225.1 hypothetical protein PSR1_03115 [Anaeromyxobacter sp. PSR-1]
MRRILAVGAAVVALAAPAAASAQMSLGVRVGYARALGDVGEGGGERHAMSDWVDAQLPVQADVMFRVTPALSIGPYVAYGWAWTGGDLEALCREPGVDCSSWSIRAGAQALYRLAPRASLSPWLGAGIGYEWIQSTRGLPGDARVNMNGVEWLNLQAGADVAATSGLRIGPFAMASLGRYGTAEARQHWPFPSSRTELADAQRFHGWVQIGIRVQLEQR